MSVDNIIGIKPDFLVLRSITKSYKEKLVLSIDELKIGENEFFSIVGPSGSGKSTLLSILSGVEEPSSGQIFLRDKNITSIPAEKRPTAMVFQSLSLFPHMTIGQNIEYPLKVKGIQKSKRKNKAIELLNTLRLNDEFYEKKITECSGGERQRIAIARVLAYDPEVLFLDEPLSALDYRLRKTLEVELKDLHKRTKKTFIYVTHSLEEAMIMSDRIAIMRDGKIIQIDKPEDIYLKPADKFIANFLGETNILPVKTNVQNGKLKIINKEKNINDEILSPKNNKLKEGYLIIRPECIEFKKLDKEINSSIEITLQNDYFLGSKICYIADYNGIQITIERPREEKFNFKVGDKIKVYWKPSDSHFVEN